MSIFLKACRREPTPFTPVWLMRQAGRYQAEYRELRRKVGFVELCKTPDLAAEVTVRAVEQLGVDAAIIFADILLVLEPLGVDFDFEQGDGPKIAHPIREGARVSSIPDEIDPEASLGFVLDAVRKARTSLPQDVALIGFAGAPFTLASYAIEGGSSRTFLETKRFMYADEGAWNALMTKLTSALATYLNAQVTAGAQAVQVFDSWVGCLSPADYTRYVMPHMRRLFSSLRKDAPTIHFGTGNPALYPRMREAGGDVIGVDWRIDLGQAWQAVGSDVAIMGNLDPVALLAPRDEMLRKIDEVLAQARGRVGHIFNLGHGILPQTDPETARALVAHVHEASAR